MSSEKNLTPYVSKSLENLLIEKEAVRRGLDVSSKGKYLSVTDGRKSYLFSKGWCSKNSKSAMRFTRKKQVTRSILKTNGIEVVRGDVFWREEMDEALSYADYIGYPLVVKPDNGNKGRLVFPYVKNSETFVSSFLSVCESYDNIVVEERFESDEIRVLTVAGKVVAANIRVPANVRGNGVNSIQELVDYKNKVRKDNPALNQMKISKVEIEVMGEAGFSPDSVPREGELVYLRKNSNLATGGENFDYTDIIHPGYICKIEEAAKAFPGLFIAGLDVFIKDICQPPEKGNWAVCEVNPSPGFSGHTYPWEGESRDVAKAIIEELFFNANTTQSIANAKVKKEPGFHGSYSYIKEKLKELSRFNR
ncbi:hypothetical protein [Halomonas mongoliensis]|uniref:hypothetical protein n=1 Tax=Halomonas mongoliensis TaxID=321265 RepID=UPI00403AA3BF